MSILGVVIRAHPTDSPALSQKLAAIDGIELGPDAGDGRLIAVIESRPGQSAAGVLADIALWPEVLNASLVYECSDSPHADDPPDGLRYDIWRSSLKTYGQTDTAPHADAAMPFPVNALSAEPVPPPSAQPT